MTTIQSETAARYLQSLRSRNYAQTTIYARGRAIVRFRAATGRDPLDLTPDEMIGWWTDLHLTPSSRAGELGHIRGYAHWAVRHGVIEADPTHLLDRPRLPRRVPRPITEASLGAALTGAPRDVCLILSLAAFCGLRACEISALEWADVTDESLLLHGKGAKERLVPVHPAVRAALRALPAGPRRGPVLRRRDEQLGRVPPHLICHWANSYLHERGIDETLHQLRHRFGTQVYLLSQDLRLTQDLLGHASPTTTALYAQWDVTHASSVVLRLPVPRALAAVAGG